MSYYNACGVAGKNTKRYTVRGKRHLTCPNHVLRFVSDGLPHDNMRIEGSDFLRVINKDGVILHLTSQDFVRPHFRLEQSIVAFLDMCHVILLGRQITAEFRYDHQRRSKTRFRRFIGICV